MVPIRARSKAGESSDDSCRQLKPDTLTQGWGARALTAPRVPWTAHRALSQRRELSQRSGRRFRGMPLGAQVRLASHVRHCQVTLNIGRPPVYRTQAAD